MAEKKIGGKTFKVEPMLAFEAIVLQARLLKMVGPALETLPEIFAGASKSDDAAEKARANAAAISAISAIFAKADPVDVATVLKDVCEIAMVRRPSGAYEHVDFDGDFTGDQKSIIPVTLFVLQEQFGDFFAGALASGSRVTKGAA